MLMVAVWTMVTRLRNTSVSGVSITSHGLQLDLLELAEKHPERVRRFIQGIRAMIRDVGLDLNPKPGG